MSKDFGNWNQNSKWFQMIAKRLKAIPKMTGSTKIIINPLAYVEHASILAILSKFRFKFSIISPPRLPLHNILCSGLIKNVLIKTVWLQYRPRSIYMINMSSSLFLRLNYITRDVTIVTLLLKMSLKLSQTADKMLTKCWQKYWQTYDKRHF